MRVVFMGTPEFAVPILEALRRGPDELCGVVCQPDRPAGRGRKLTPPPVKRAALLHGIPVLQPEKLRAAEALEQIRHLAPELIAVAAYGKILPPAWLQLPPRGCVNVHASLLPRYRGAAPIQWAILEGETVTGVTIMQMNERMDAGDILLQRDTAIGPEETCGQLQERLAELGALALCEAIEGLRRGELRARPQDESAATLAPRLEKADGRIDWRRPAVEIERRTRAFNPWPSAYTQLGDLQLKVHRARVVVTDEPSASRPPAEAVPGTVVEVRDLPVVACGEGLLRLEEVQLEGRQQLDGASFARGARLQRGVVLGGDAD